MKVGAFRGATCWEAYLGRVWITIPFPLFLRLGCWPRVGWDRDA